MNPLICLLLILAVLPAISQEAGQQDFLNKLPPLPFKEESVGNFSAKGVPGLGPKVDVKGLVVGTPLKVDAAFTMQHENTPSSVPFVVVIPKNKGVAAFAGGKKSGVPELVKFATMTAEKQAIEILRFTNLTVSLQASAADRLKLCAHLLSTKGLAGASSGYEKVKFLEAYATRIGGNDAVCVHAHMTAPTTGEHYAVKLVGILHPGEPGGVLAFLMASTKLSEIKSPEDLGSKGVGLAIIHSLKFVDAPKPGAKP